jgi:hypothetical protein
MVAACTSRHLGTLVTCSHRAAPFPPKPFLLKAIGRTGRAAFAATPMPFL